MLLRLFFTNNIRRTSADLVDDWNASELLLRAAVVADDHCAGDRVQEHFMVQSRQKMVVIRWCESVASLQTVRRGVAAASTTYR